MLIFLYFETFTEMYPVTKIMKFSLCFRLRMYSVVGIVLSFVLLPALILWTWLLIPALQVIHQCPTGCWCDAGGINMNCARISMTDIKIQFEGLKKLTIDYNNITTLKKDTFLSNKLTSLEILSANNCGILSIEPGTFTGLHNLQQIFLKSNKLRTLKPCTFNGLTNLEYLYLADNKIEVIGSDIFMGLVNLRTIVLDYNNIRHIQSNAFSTNVHLNKLSLRSNRKLQISSERLFIDSESLEQLSISGCNISSVSGKTFRNITSLKIVDLSDNNLNSISINVFFTLPSLTRFYLSGNPLSCDCDLLKVWEWSEDHNITTVSYWEEPMCNYPDEVKGLWWEVLKYATCENETIYYQGTYRNVMYQQELPDLQFQADTDVIQYVQAVLYILLFVVGAVGNVILLFITMSSKEMRTEPNIYIFNLALSDLLSLSTNLPIWHVHTMLDKWEYGDSMCKLFMFCRRLTIGVSAYSVAILSIQRYHVTVDPIQNRSTAKWRSPVLNILGVWLLASAFALPAAFSAHAKGVCGMFYSLHYYQKVVLFELLVSCILPLSVIVFMYAMTARHLVKSVASMSGQAQHPHNTVRRNIAKIVLGLVLVFVVSFVPYHAIRAYRYWSGMAYEVGLQYAWSLSTCMLLLNSCFNPVALFCSSSSFRKVFKCYMMCFCKRLSASVSVSMSPRSSKTDSIRFSRTTRTVEEEVV